MLHIQGLRPAQLSSKIDSDPNNAAGVAPQDQQKPTNTAALTDPKDRNTESPSNSVEGGGGEDEAVGGYRKFEVVKKKQLLKLLDALLWGVFILWWIELTFTYLTKFKGSMAKRLSYPTYYWFIIYFVKLCLQKKGIFEKYGMISDFVVANSAFIINFSYVALLCEFIIYGQVNKVFEFTPVILSYVAQEEYHNVLMGSSMKRKLYQRLFTWSYYVLRNGFEYGKEGANSSINAYWVHHASAVQYFCSFRQLYFEHQQTKQADFGGVPEHT
ncbi:hypothetical protein FGO68_gene2028 [Halteria grandinella]|uniref:Uncharacterized protein n=1 Tax=Halteria grandinella TaxID=5974 RepID=A0A8J8P0U1_HALGN|nr:hypothetical protein FGO68_gene2028 [Halteria grandinella]